MSELEKELLQLFDLRKVKLREARKLSAAVAEANKEFKLLTIWFAEGVPDLSVSVNDEERLLWDSRLKKVLYARNEVIQIIDAVESAVVIRMRPHLQQLVRCAKEKFLAEDCPVSS